MVTRKLLFSRNWNLRCKCLYETMHLGDRCNPHTTDPTLPEKNFQIKNEVHKKRILVDRLKPAHTMAEGKEKQLNQEKETLNQLSQ